MSYRAYDDHHSRLVFKAFQERLAPLIAEVAPDWLMHHMMLDRRPAHETPCGEEVHIRLVLRPIGFAREVPTPPALTTTPARLE